MPSVEDDVVTKRREWARLKTILSNESESYERRSAALKTACETAGAGQALQIIQVVRSWTADAELPRSAEDPQKASTTQHVAMRLTREFIRNYLSRVAELMGDQRPVLELLESLIATTHWLFDGLHRPVLELIANSSAPLAARRAVAVRILTSNIRIGGYPAFAPLFPLVDASFFPRWREIVRDPTNDLNFRYNSAAFLAHFGDREILEYLKQWHSNVLPKSLNLAGHIERDILMIEAQESAAKLLEYIALTGGRLSRPWAVQRALDTGITPARLRTAVLEHAANMSKLDDAPKEYLSYWKRDMIQAGVLHDDDLPNVKLPKPPRPFEE